MLSEDRLRINIDKEYRRSCGALLGCFLAFVIDK